MPDALLIDDDRSILEPLILWVQREGFRAESRETLAGAREAIEETDYDVIIADLELPDGKALELLPDLKDRPGTQVILITGHGTVSSAVEAFRLGVVDYLIKPVDTLRLRQILRNVRRTIELRAEVDGLRDELRHAGRFGKMIGASKVMQAVYDQVLRVAPTNAPVLVIGETGTGKELVAETVHRLSPRAKQPYVTVNCGAIAPTLVESELFGHEKGSFTGATNQHVGLFERAHEGTLFLDEITEMPPDLQVKLLRVLETREVHRIGGSAPIAADVRVVAATNRDPHEAVAAGRLREDLLYRLMVFPIQVPPLREREGDVEQIAEHLLSQMNQQAGTHKRFTQEALDALATQPWPGNVRELRNCIERAFILAGDRIGCEALPFRGQAASPPARDGVWLPLGASIADAERDLIRITLDHHEGDRTRTAQALGISVRTLYNRLKEYGWNQRSDTLLEDPRGALPASRPADGGRGAA
jgi:DNA-binding NtrC family response regulator